MLFRFFKRINANAGLFNGYFVDVKAFYAFQFTIIPCITFIGDLDITKAHTFVKENNKAGIISAYQHSYFSYDDKKIYFNNTFVVLTAKRMIEIADNYCQLLHTINQYTWAREFVNDLAQFRIERNDAHVIRPTQIVGFAKEAEMN
jgi:hypothetical protein